MSESREELVHLIEQLADEKINTLLSTARAIASSRQPSARSWPPAFFGSITNATNGRHDNANRVDELLAEAPTMIPITLDRCRYERARIDKDHPRW